MVPFFASRFACRWYKVLQQAAIVMVLAVLSGCSRYEVVSIWKTPNLIRPNYHKVLVAGIAMDSAAMLRSQLEADFINELQALGYNAVGYVAEFGPQHLAELHQEETYRRLCNRGIDAVITIALIDQKKEQHGKAADRLEDNTAVYFYNRVWNYQKMEGDRSQPVSFIANTAYKWECIFFDLNTLEALSTVQTKPFNPATTESGAAQYIKKITALMQRKKVLVRQAALPKAF